jgi:hypothetical protein
MNRIQVIGQLDVKKHRLILGKSDSVELLLPPSSQELKDLSDGAWVEVVGDIWSHPARKESCVIRAAIINLFPGEKSPWANGRLTLKDPQWIHSDSFSTASSVLGISDSNDIINLRMPLLESRWKKKVGGLVQAKGRVDMEVIIKGASRLECVALLNDETTSGLSKGHAPAIHGCDALDWFDKQQSSSEKPGKRRSISPKIRREVFLRDGFKCQECGASPSKDRFVYLEVDHVVARVKGGSDLLGNLQTLCNTCNAGKGTDPAYAPAQEVLQ